jgi:uroporphyrinogen-III decarboxylase
MSGHHCLAGGMTPSLLQFGSVQEVKDECKKLIEVVGRDGGYIMSHSVPLDEARIENVRAMIEFTREYGVYR